MNPLHQRYDEQEKRLSALKNAFSNSEEGRKYLGWFEEYISVNEYEIALHRLVDFLLEPNTPAVTESVIEDIQKLHALMKLEEDDCVERLKEKADHRQ